MYVDWPCVGCEKSRSTVKPQLSEDSIIQTVCLAPGIEMQVLNNLNVFAWSERAWIIDVALYSSWSSRDGVGTKWLPVHRVQG